MVDNGRGPETFWVRDRKRDAFLSNDALVLRYLNELGKEQWEVAAGSEQEHVWWYLLKRQTRP